MNSGEAARSVHGEVSRLQFDPLLLAHGGVDGEHGHTALITDLQELARLSLRADHVAGRIESVRHHLFAIDMLAGFQQTPRRLPNVSGIVEPASLLHTVVP